MSRTRRITAHGVRPRRALPGLRHVDAPSVCGVDAGRRRPATIAVRHGDGRRGLLGCVALALLVAPLLTVSSAGASTIPRGATGKAFCTDYGQSAAGSFDGIYACTGPDIGTIDFYGRHNALIHTDSTGFQCVELSARYLYTLGYGVQNANGEQVASTYAKRFGIPTGHSSWSDPLGNLAFLHPGDVMSMWANDVGDVFGHVAIVTGTSGNAFQGVIDILSENQAGPSQLNVVNGVINANRSFQDENGVPFSSFEWLKLSTSSTPANGSFVKTPNGHVYRVAGGAALPVTNCKVLGGCGSPIDVPNLDAFSSTVANDEVLVAPDAPGGGEIFKAVGGTLLALTSCTSSTGSYPTCAGIGSVHVNYAAIAAYDAQHPTIAQDGLVVVAVDAPGGASVYKSVGGTLLPVSKCLTGNVHDPCVSPSPWFGLNYRTVTAYDSEHPRIDEDGLVVVAPDAPGGASVYEALGGTLLPVSKCLSASKYNPCGGSGWFGVNYDIVTSYDAAHPTVAQNGLVVVAADAPGGASVYKAVGGTFLPVTKCLKASAYNPCTGSDWYGINDAILNAYVEANPSIDQNGLIVVAPDGPSGVTRFKSAGGALLPLPTCAALPSSTETTCSGTTIDLNDAAVTSYDASHAVPSSGTTLLGLPSGTYWVISGGKKEVTSAISGAVSVDDASLAGIPTSSP